ncbi:MAG: ATP-binding protein [Crenarchaeota archaeon]|nr:ATP-binding protein [Thermoproteota archaeon]
MVDPRISIISERLKLIKRIIAVSSGKGGVGKSFVATTLALSLSKQGYKVGLFDLDFTSPSTHVLLGVKNLQPVEDKGLIPPKVHELLYMSLIYYSGNQAAPLRGVETSNALIELLAVTLWGKLDFLIIDMPPGIGDAVLDLIKLVSRIEFIIVTTSSQLAFETVKKQLRLLKELNISIVGLVENMKPNQSDAVKKQTNQLNVKYVVGIPYDSAIEDSVGDPKKLLSSIVGKKIASITKVI